MTALLLLLACGDKDVTDAPDSDSEADADTDTDTDTDVEACDVAQLTFAAVVADSSGPCTTACVSPVDVTGTVRNNGDATCSFESSNSCLIGRAVIGTADGAANLVDVKPSCDDALTTFTFPPGSSQKQLVIDDATLAAGSYKATVYFNDPNQSRAIGGFDLP